MQKFPTATVVPKTHYIEGLEGQWSQAKYSEAKNNPEAVRAIKGNSISWFVPVDLDDGQEVVSDADSEADTESK